MKIKKLTDAQCLELFQEMLASRVKVGTAYISNPDNGVLTHQLLLITCGALKVQSAPEPLTVPLIPAIPSNTTVN